MQTTGIIGLNRDYRVYIRVEGFKGSGVEGLRFRGLRLRFRGL